MARRVVDEFLSRYDIGVECREALRVAVSEACANAVLYGAPRGRRDRFQVRCEVGAFQVDLTVVDSGPGLPDRCGARLPDGRTEHGRGFLLMRSLVDEVRVESGRSGATVRLVKRVSPEGGRGPAPGWLPLSSLSPTASRTL